MPYWPSKSVIYIHINRAGGTSIQQALKATLPPPRLAAKTRVTREEIERFAISPAYLDYFWHHLPARELRKALGGEIWERCFKFAFVRNPWDRLVSHYFFNLRRDDPVYHHEGRYLDFNEWILTGKWFNATRNPPQSTFVTDGDGTLLVDFVGRFETMNADFRKVCERIGIRAKLPHVNRSSHPYYRRLYTEETKRLVAEQFASDIELFGYRFDEGRRWFPSLFPRAS